MRSQLPGLVNFTQKSKVRGDSCSDIIERGTQLICRQKKNFHSTRSYLSLSGKYKVLGLNRDLLIENFDSFSRPMDILSLFAVE